MSSQFSIKKIKNLCACFVSVFCIITCREEKEPKSQFQDVLGSIETTIPIGQRSSNDENFSFKKISLNQITVSNLFLQRQLEISEKLQSTVSDYREDIVPFSESPNAVDLGMGSVPVLDQGAYGTCVTFATIAALDALLEQGDLISQQCFLELSKDFGKNYWFGAQHSLQILKPLREYGIVEHAQCPDRYGQNNMVMSANAYSKLSSRRFNVGGVVGHFIEPITLDVVKTALNKKHRITIGFGLKNDRTSTAVIGFSTQIKGQHTIGGLWACNKKGSATNYCGLPNSGHEVVIIGYDDTQKLLKVRNSWGDLLGDNGDFYMTYDFFEMMSFNGTEIY